MRALLLSTSVLAGCESTGDESLAGLLDGSILDAGLLDAAMPELRGDSSVSKLDASSPALDASAPALDAGPACYSPVNLPADGGALELIPGCACLPSNRLRPDKNCVGPYQVTCRYDGDRLWEVSYGRCISPYFDSAAVCSVDPNMAWITRLDPSETCPTGFSGILHTTDPAAGVGECCEKIFVTPDNCTEAGLTLLAAGTQSDNILETRCSNGGQLRAFVSLSYPELRLCCTQR